MSVYKSGKMYRVDLKWKEGRFTHSFPTQDQASSYKTGMLKARREGKDLNCVSSTLLPSSSQFSSVKTFGQLFDRIWDAHWSKKKGRATYKSIGKYLINKIGYNTPLTSFTKLFISELCYVIAQEKLSNGEPWSQNTINRKLQGLRTMLNYAADQGFIEEAPKVKVTSDQLTEIVIPTDEERMRAMSLFYELRKQAGDFFVLADDTGFRTSEVFQIGYKDLKTSIIQGREVTLLTLSDPRNLKSGKPRSVPATKRVIKVLEQSDHELCLRGYSKEKLRFDWNIVRNKMGKGDIDRWSPHILRHAYITRLISRGLPIHLVKELAGHADIKTTMRYTHLAPRQMQDALDVLEG